MPNTKKPDALVTHLALYLEAKAIAGAVRKLQIAWWIYFTCPAVAWGKFRSVMQTPLMLVFKLDKMVKLASGEGVYHGKSNRSITGFDGSDES